MLAALLAWQVSEDGTSPAPEAVHLRYERAVVLPTGAQGQACAVLDATVYAHAAEASVRDLRLFAATGDGHEREVPYAMSESDTQPGEVAEASLGNITAHGSDLSFDLAMPPRAYSAVELKLDAPEFVGVAHVTGLREAAGSPVPLGSFLVFDLTQQHLARSTTLALAETNYPLLRVSLHLMGPGGHALPRVSAAMIAGASVPPSREAQVLYTTVAKSTAMSRQGQDTVMQFPAVAEHVPVERVRFVLQPGARTSFLREVTLTATPLDTKGESGAGESMKGAIAVMDRPGVADAPAIHYESLAFPATLGSTLGSAASVEVRVHDGAGPPPPIVGAVLEMRRRSLCFDAAPSASYTLRYGDASLAAASSEYARSFAPATHMLQAQLGPEQMNPAFVPRMASRPYASEHPEAISVGLLVLIAVAGLAGLESVKRQRDR